MTALPVPAAPARVSLTRSGDEVGQGLLLLSLWIWAIWSCAEHWRGNPNYSYGWAVPLLAVGFGLRRFWRLNGASFSSTSLPAWAGVVAIFLGLLGLGLEYAREDMWHPEIVLCGICLLCVCMTLLVFRLSSGSLFREELFPVLFFFTAVPWPPRIEQPLTAALMRWVASATTEILHWMGIEATVSGGAIAMQSGLVGITEACSGIRSLQAGIMFGLAMGEWFLLRPSRRVLLLVLAVIFALLSNLGRTLTLALQAEWHGIAALERIHDFTGNVAITALVLAIAVSAKLLAGRKRSPIESEPNLPTPVDAGGLTSHRNWIWSFATAVLLAGIFSARLLYARADAQAHTQTVPFFYTRVDGPGIRLLPVGQEVLNELRPTSGESVRRDSDDGVTAGYCFHFFWKPSVWNRFVLVHRPDICMPGIGWESTGAPEPIEVKFGDDHIRFYVFRFRRGDVHALELWGAWRNGDPVPLEYTPNQVFGAAPPPTALDLKGKRRSATEIVACTAIAGGREPSSEIAVALLQSVMEYKKNE